MNFDPEQLASRVVSELFGPTAKIERSISEFCFVVEHGQKYFLKVFREPVDVTKIRTSLSYYQRVGFETPEVIKSGTIDSTKYGYVVYTYLEGENLYHHAYHSSRRDEILLDYGEKIGARLRWLHAVTPLDEDAYDTRRIPEVTERVLVLLDEMATWPAFHEHFSAEDLALLRSNFIESAMVMKGRAKFLIHGDVKTPNFMIDDKGRLAVVDVEATCLGDDIMNFQYQLVYALSSPLEQPFALGYLNGVYDHTRPAGFGKIVQYAFTTSLAYACHNRLAHKDFAKLTTDLIEARRSLQTILDGSCLFLKP